LRDEGLLKHERLRSEFVEIGRDYALTPVAGECVGAELIRQQDKQVWFSREPRILAE